MASVPHESASQIVGPLILANLINWGLCGALSLQLYVYASAAGSREARSAGAGVVKRRWNPRAALAAASGFGQVRSKRRLPPWKSRSTSKDDYTVNPWTVSISGPPTVDHSSSSFDPYASAPSPSNSPSTEESHANRLPRIKQQDGDVGGFPTQRSTSSKLAKLDDDISHPEQPRRLMSRYAQLIVTLYALVCTQSLFSTAYFWRVAVDGWGTGAGPPDTSWLATLSVDIFGPIIFTFTLAFYLAYFFLFPPAFSLRVQPSANSSTPKSTALRTLFILKAKVAAAQSSSTRHRSSRTETDQYNPFHSSYTSYNPYGYTNGHIRPLPSKWQSLKRRSRQSIESLGVTDFLDRMRPYAFPLSLALVILIVFACGLFNGGRRLSERRAVGAMPIFDGPAAVWYVGSVVLNLLVFVFLVITMLGSRAADSRPLSRSSGLPITVRIIRVLVESGAMQLAISLLALVLQCAYSSTKSPTSVPLVPSTILPAIYVNTLILVLTRSFSDISLTNLTPKFVPSPPIVSTPVKPVKPSQTEREPPLAERKDDIEMTAMTGLRSIISTSRPEANTMQRIRFSGSGFGVSSGSGVGSGTGNSGGSGSGTNTSSGSNSGGTFSETNAGMIRTAALALGVGTDYQPIQQQYPPLPLATTRSRGEDNVVGASPPPRMHMERDTLGETSAGRQRGASENGNEANTSLDPPQGTSSATLARRKSALSNLSTDALSLELPVFRKGRAHYPQIGYWADDDLWDDDDDSDSVLSSEGDGTWDYGYSLNVAAMEREREKEEREKAATLMAGQTLMLDRSGPSQPPQPQQNSHPLKKRNSYPTFSLSRHGSRRRSAQPPVTTFEETEEVVFDDDVPDTPQVNSTLAAQPQYIRPLPPIPSIPQTLPLALKPSHHRRLLQQHAPDDTSVLIISGSRDPSIVEPSVYRAASVAATRASTGSMWSSYTYPKPMAFPDLDEDLQNLHGDELSGRIRDNGSGFFYNSEQDTSNGASLSNVGTATGSREGGLTGIAFGALDGAPSSAVGAHPYATANHLDDDVRDALERENNRRRWRVHPLKRMVEMGRFRR